MSNEKVDKPALANQAGSNPSAFGPERFDIPHDHYEHVGSSKISPAPPVKADYSFPNWLKTIIAGHEAELITEEERKYLSGVYSLCDKNFHILTHQIGTQQTNEQRIRAALAAGEPAPNLSVNYNDLERLREPFISESKHAVTATMPVIERIWDRVRPLAKAWLQKALAAERGMYERQGITNARSQVREAYAVLMKELDAKPIKSGCGGPPHPSVNLDLLGIQIPFEPYTPKKEQEPTPLAA